MGDEYDAAEAAYWANAEEFKVTGVGVYPHYCLTSEVHNVARPKETEMRNDQDILTQAEELRAEAERLERIVAERKEFGADPFKNGDVLKVEMRYRTGSRRSFAYAVVKVAGKFYLSGRLARAATDGSTSIASGFTWEQFVAWLAQGDATVWQARALKQVF